MYAHTIDVSIRVFAHCEHKKLCSIYWVCVEKRHSAVLGISRYTKCIKLMCHEKGHWTTVSMLIIF